MASLGKLAAAFPELLQEMAQGVHIVSDMAKNGGMSLDRRTTNDLAAAQAKHGRSGRIALWIGAISLAVLAITEIF